MSFWDNVKKLTQPYSDDDYDEFEDDAEELDEVQESAPRARRTSPFATSENSDYTPAASSVSTASATSTGSSFGSSSVLSSGNKQEVILFHAKSFDDAAKAANELRKKKAIILNMENVDKALTRRVVDFLSGSVYALDGSVKKVAQSTYLFCPHNMDVVGDLETIHNETESFM